MSDPRYKTYRWQKIRARQLASEPLCKMCLDEGISTIANICDHRIPHRGDDELFWNGPFQSLCAPCHNSDKQRIENLAAANHPDWLEPSAIPLTIVSGPPASGKTTYIEQNAKPGDIIIDLDGIMRSLRPEYQHWQGGLDKRLFNRAIRQRNTMLANLKREQGKRAWFIVSAPTQSERNWWQRKLGGEIVLLHPANAGIPA